MWTWVDVLYRELVFRWSVGWAFASQPWKAFFLGRILLRYSTTIVHSIVWYYGSLRIDSPCSSQGSRRLGVSYFHASRKHWLPLGKFVTVFMTSSWACHSADPGISSFFF